MDYNNDSIRHVYVMEFYTPSLLEEIRLKFVPLQTHQSPDGSVQYKLLGDSMYVYEVKLAPESLPDVPSDHGYSNPERN
jgi:hypothetical protein